VIDFKHASFVKLLQNFRAQSGQSTPEHLAAPQALVDAGTLRQAEFNSAKQRIIGG
jgi:hypothetical protein